MAEVLKEEFYQSLNFVVALFFLNDVVSLKCPYPLFFTLEDPSLFRGALNKVGTRRMKLRFYQTSNAGLVTRLANGDKRFQNVLCRHEGILAILVTDRDGVPLVKGKSTESKSSVNLYYNSLNSECSRETLVKLLNYNAQACCSVLSYMHIWWSGWLSSLQSVNPFC